MKKSTVWIYTVSMLVGALRFTSPGTHQVVSWEDSYEAMAHIWIGVVLALAFLRPNVRKLCVVVLVALSALELLMFFKG
jgi:hypothetical protein